jgi:riboflavin kinase/FMN adenylyltransferase
MQHYRSLDGIHLDHPWLTIGSFDGVHRGHQTLIRDLVQGAHAAGCDALALTFYPHPAVVLRGLEGPFYLTTPDERAELLGGLGLDGVITLEFNPHMAALTAREFMSELVARTLLSRLVIGYDFALGHGRQGDTPTLRRLGVELGYQVQIVDPVMVDGEVVSSSRIRTLLGKGDVVEAARFLGRNYSMQGEVVRGDGRGRALGFPTANMDIWREQLLPASGIYATWTWIDGQRWPSVSNVGVRPTFETGPVPPRVEAYVLGWDQDLYGKNIRLDYVRYLREERRYADVNALIAQMRLDVQQAEGVFNDESRATGLSA